MKEIKYGKDYLAELKFPHLKKRVTIYYWDVWISIVLESKHCNGSIAHLLDTIRPSKYNNDFELREAYEELRNEILSYQQKLVTNQLQAADILEKIQEVQANPDFLKTQLTTAYTNVVELDFEEEDKTWKMRFTPRKVKKKAALREYLQVYWNGNEEETDETLEEGDPLDYLEDIEEKFEALYDSLEEKYRQYPDLLFSDEEDFKLAFDNFNQHDFVKDLRANGLRMDALTEIVAKKIANTIKRLSKKLNIFKLFALHRGVMTVLVEHAEIIDDPSGNIRKIAQNAFKKYISLDRSEVVMTSLDYYMDLLNIMIWEDYDYFKPYWPDVFINLTADDIEAIEFILQEEQEELKQAELNEVADKIPTLLGLLYGQNKLFDQFIPTATLMGTKNLDSVIQLAAIAADNQKPDLAKAVFEAALQDKKGFYYKHLNQEYKKIK